MLFLDQEDAATTLGALRSKAYVRDATLLTLDGRVFASLLPASDPDAIRQAHVRHGTRPSATQARPTQTRMSPSARMAERSLTFAA